MKYSNYAGVLAALLLIISCFLPWAYYPDLQKTFTGFFSEQNIYGRPGKALIFLAIVMSLFFMAPKVWAKRANIFVGILVLGFAIKSFVLFSACYHGICPEKKIGIFTMLTAALLMVAAALLPTGKINNES